MKKILPLFLIFALLTGCGGTTNKNDTLDTENVTREEEESELVSGGVKNILTVFVKSQELFDNTDFSKLPQDRLIEIGVLPEENGEYFLLGDGRALYKCMILSGKASESDHKLTIKEAVDIIDKYKEDGIDKIVHEFLKIQKYPDAAFGSGIYYISFIPHNNYDNSNYFRMDGIYICVDAREIRWSHYVDGRRKDIYMYRESDYIKNQ